MWASITNDKRGFAGGEHFKDLTTPELKLQKPFKDMKDIANFFIRLDTNYRKTSIRSEGLFVGTLLSGFVLDVESRILYTFYRGDGLILPINPTY